MRWSWQLAAGLAAAALCCACVAVSGEQERSTWPSSEIPAPRGVVRIATYNLWNLFFHWNFRSTFIAEQVRPTRILCLSVWPRDAHDAGVLRDARVSNDPRSGKRGRTSLPCKK